jgi:hypothetical protein
MRARDLGGEGGHRDIVGEVDDVGRVAVTGATRRRRKALGVPVDERDPCAVCGQLARDLRAHPARRSRDDARRARDIQLRHRRLPFRGFLPLLPSILVHPVP